MGGLMKEFFKGLWNDNPTFRLQIGLCPVLAVTSSALNGLGMGLATTFVLICSSVLISLLKNVIPSKVRIPCYIIVIATFSTIVDLVMHAFLPDLHRVLGIFIPLIVVNCILMGRAEAFASKNSVVSSALDGLGMGLGFTWALTLIGAIREILGSGSIFNHKFVADTAATFGFFSLPPGAFVTVGILIAGMNIISARLRKAS
ncbi:MAG: electron transport complex subunit E [Firmicutes bacterium]|jgi:electron transport complex protein RnfE|nr:electron transport complex subunit E [Bacillota bacterium]